MPEKLTIQRLIVALACIVFGLDKACAENREEKPGNDMPDYPAADQTTVRAIALPYLVYRGDFWRVGGEDNRGAVSGRFWKDDRFEFDVTLSAAFPVDSGENDARRDMPDLDFLFGIGRLLVAKDNPGAARIGGSWIFTCRRVRSIRRIFHRSAGVVTCSTRN